MRLLPPASCTVYAVLLLSACGGPPLAATKEAAAQAAFTAGQGGVTGGGLLDLFGSRLYGNELIFGCAHSGRRVQDGVENLVSIRAEIESSRRMNVRFEACNQDGLVTMDGTFSLEQNIFGGSLLLEQVMDGRVTFSGAVSDFVQLALTERLSVAQHAVRSGKVDLFLIGTVETSSDGYGFAQETISVEAGSWTTATGQ